MTPLTDAQRELADAHLTLAVRIAESFAARHWLGASEEARSAAYYGLCRAAATFDPARGASFATWAGRRILGAIIDAQRDAMPSGFRRKNTAARAAGGKVPTGLSLDSTLFREDDHEVNAGQLIPADELPVGWELESLDEVAWLAGKLTKTQRRVVLDYYTRAGTTYGSIGRERGTTPNATAQHLQVALATLRESPNPSQEST